MNLAAIAAALNKVTTAVSMFTPFTSMLGIGKNITDLIASGLDIGKNVLDRVEDGSVVATTDDKEELKRVIAELEALNADLDAYIRDS